MADENISISETRMHGKSYFALHDFTAGERVFVVAGPVIKKPTIYTIPISHDLFIDPTEGGGKYLCHSCDPNCGIKRRTEIVTMRDIRQGEEITIDYAMIVNRYGTELPEANRVCHCESPICRGKLGSYEELLQKLKEKYKGFISDYLLES